MTQKERVLFVSQEVVPYLPESHQGKIGRHLPQGTQERARYEQQQSVIWGA